MFYSMTGYGIDTISNEQFTLETEVKSLNSRFLDLMVRLPKELNQHEIALREFVKSKIIRGKVSISFTVTPVSDSNENKLLNEPEFAKTIELLERIKKEIGSTEKITLDQLLTVRDQFFLHNETDNGIQIEFETLKDSLNRALDNLIQMRSDEGEQLKKDFLFRIENIENSLNQIEEISQNSTKEYFDKFKEKAKKLYDEFVDDENRFMVELGILSEKHDVTEECIRLRSHIKLFNETIEKAQDVGRKLNFICQEMNREVNTINSKSISSEISHLGINIKEELEKIREQVQNIE
ncbi:MAG: YicC family protein [Ignavibacteriales bacterium]|nr:YicC family protein [Ignavibacteriales bacterium]